MGMPREESFWRKLVAEVEAGASQVEVARRHDVSASALGYWVRRGKHTQPSAALLPVRVVDDARRRLEIAIGDVRVAVEDGTDPGYVAALIRAIRAC